MTPAPALLAARHFFRLSGRTLTVRLGTALAGVTALVTGVALLSGGPPSFVSEGVSWLSWAALAFALTGVNPADGARVPTARQMSLRGVNLAAQRLGQELSRFSQLFLCFVLPTLFFGLCLLPYSDSLKALAGVGLSTLGFVAASAASAAALSGLAALSQQLSPSRASRVLLALVLVPHALSSALPALPSWFAGTDWLFRTALSPVSG